MKTADASILIVPGLGGFSPTHWQTRWAQKLPSAHRVTPLDLDRPNRAQWVEAVANAVAAAEKPVVLVGHSLGVAAIAHAASAFARPIVGAFLVSLPNVNRPDLIPGVEHDFGPIPREPFVFPSLLIASRNDPYCDFEVAADHANAWGSALIDAGEAGHLDVESGHGPWPEGLLRFAGFLRRLPAS